MTTKAKKPLKFTKKDVLCWFNEQQKQHGDVTTRHKVRKFVMGHYEEVAYIVQRGYMQLGILMTDADTNKEIKREEGGWKPSLNGMMYVAVCQCGAISTDWSERQVTKDILKMRINHATGGHVHPKATGRMTAVKK